MKSHFLQKSSLLLLGFVMFCGMGRPHASNPVEPKAEPTASPSPTPPPTVPTDILELDEKLLEIPPIRQCLYCMTFKRGLLMPPQFREHAFWVTQSDDGLHCLEWPNVGSSNEISWKGVIPPGKITFFHSHPLAGQYMGRFNEHDREVARKLQMVLYITVGSEVVFFNPHTDKVTRIDMAPSYQKMTKQEQAEACSKLEPMSP